MRLPKWVGSVLKIGTSWIPGVGTAVEEGLDHLKEHQDRRSMIASLLELEEQKWRPDASPAALLRADFGVVPFHGREAELQDLARWCDSDRPLALRLFTAPGGFGKTRLLRHFVRIRRDEWDTGFLPEGKLTQEAIEALLGTGKKPLLLVLDYAESRASEIEALVRAATHTTRPRVRMVLLARAEGDWWSELRRAGDGVGDFFQGPAVEGPILLLPLTDSSEARRDSYQNAIRAFAKVVGKEAGPALSRDAQLDHEDFERVLLVHVAALAAVEGEQVSTDNLLDWLLTREERGIDRVREKQAGLGPEMQRVAYHAAALVTLAQGADSRDETVEIISRAPSLKDQPRARQEQVAEVLHVLYQGRRWCDGVEPDLVGEQLVSLRLREAPELLEAAFGPDISEARLGSGLTILNRLAQRRPGDRHFLESAIRKGLRHLALPAARVAVAGGDPIGVLLADALSQSGDLEVAQKLERSIPIRTTSLREAAAQVEEMLWRELQARAAEPSELARRAGTRSNRLAAVGRQEEALEAIREAARSHRALAQSDPDTFRPDLAVSLNQLSNRLADLGRREESLEAVHESVEIYRNLAGARPDERNSRLAASLNNLSVRLAELGRYEDALEAIRESAALLRSLAEARPDEFKADFAASLANLSNQLANLGQREEALEQARETVTIYQNLAEARPDAFKPTLAASLTNLANRLADVGRHEEALGLARRAVEIDHGLADARPDAFRPDLALSLNNFSNRLSRVGRHEEALGPVREAVAIYRDLADVRPDMFRPDLAMSLNNFSNRLADVGRREEAMESIREATVIYRGLADELPDVFKRYLAGSLHNLSVHLGEAGRSEEAVRANREAIDIYSGLVEVWPDAFRPSLAMSLGQLQRLLRDAGQTESALHVSDRAIHLLEPSFIQLPQAHAGLMKALIADYEQTATACGVEPDRERLHRIGKILAELREEG